MKAITPIIFCSFVLAALSSTQGDAFARGLGHHGGDFRGGGDFAARDGDRSGGFSRDDDKYHSVLSHPEEADRSSDFTASSGFDAASGFDAGSGFKDKGPETISVDDFGAAVSLGPVHEDDVAAAHPESKTQQQQQAKPMVSCKTAPYTCTS